MLIVLVVEEFAATEKENNQLYPVIDYRNKRKDKQQNKLAILSEAKKLIRREF
jgi:hypothetical protein